MPTEMLDNIKELVLEYSKEFIPKVAEREIATSKGWLIFGIVLVVFAIMTVAIPIILDRYGKFVVDDWIGLCLRICVVLLFIGLPIIFTQIDDIYTATYTPEITFWRYVRNTIIGCLQ